MSSQDILNLYKLDTDILGSHTAHRTFTSDVSRGIRRLKVTEKWYRDNPIGRGGFAQVFLEREEKGKLRAIKEIHKSFGQSQGYDYLREVLSMVLTPDKTYFPELFGWFEDDQNLYIAMEFFPLGDLSKCISGPQPEADTRIIVSQVAEALEVLQEKQITHRDIKPENIFVCRTSPQWWIKLGDFGISKRVQGDDTSLHTSFGGGCYIAPEVYGENTSHDSYTSAVDTWSLGCVLFWLSTGRTPLSIWKQTLRGKAVSREEFQTALLAPAGLDLLQACLSLEPEQRPTPMQIAQSDWIKAHVENAYDNLEVISTTSSNDLSTRLVEDLDSSLKSPLTTESSLHAEGSISASADLEPPSDQLLEATHSIKPKSSSEENPNDQLYVRLSAQSLAQLVPNGNWQSLFDDDSDRARLIAEQKLTILIGRGYDFPCEADAPNALHFAAEYGLINLVDHLYSQGADIYSTDEDGLTVIHCAAYTGRGDMITHLCSLDANAQAKDKKGRTAIFTAAITGQIDVIRYLISLGLNIDHEDNLGRTAIFEAAWGGQKDTVKFLSSLGLAIGHEDNDGQTAIYMAAQQGQIDMIKYLISLGLDINHEDNYGRTAMFEAASGGWKDTVKYLSSIGLDVRQKDNIGQTTIFAAVEGGKMDMVKHLSSLGLDIMHKDDDGDTAIVKAARGGQIDIVKYLSSLGPRTNTPQEQPKKAREGGKRRRLRAMFLK